MVAIACESNHLDIAALVCQRNKGRRSSRALRHSVVERPFIDVPSLAAGAVRS